ncbi:AAC(3) family N-acetyltransferase [Tsukamurella sp. 8F]|uniref:aminoglycoside N(3)-acetyltransferase n=1 Tax=unclassified Tsukamurella TaxID=2633480 RepID=UPI0023B9BAE3|nr:MULTISPECIES: AAC(3) family N-acetyltransferase [unclassified Tsukamurella]MDF0529039.1 AAC(3) family N-acetyltransferase [Tsukamurella sp. 8J]MDF0587412.1 AAC(3) family N-acetyltransferase [Tsukamurella sp. 8F]
MAPSTAPAIAADLRAAGVTHGDSVLVHSSLSSLGTVDGGADTVVDALLTAVGPEGTVVVPAYSGTVTDPCPDRAAGDTTPDVLAARDAVPLFDADVTATEMGAVPRAVLARPGRRRSPHPQASVAAIGRHADVICEGQPLAFALGAASPFARLVELDAKILLLGVGHNRSSMLHHVESAIDDPHRRLKIRRFPYEVAGQRIWIEARDVGNDNDTYFPELGRRFEDVAHTVVRGVVGDARSVVFGSREYVATTRPMLDALLRDRGASGRAARGGSQHAHRPAGRFRTPIAEYTLSRCFGGSYTHSVHDM